MIGSFRTASYPVSEVNRGMSWERDVLGDSMITAVTAGIHYKWFTDLPADIRNQIRLCDLLWDDLVASNQMLEADRAAIWSSFPKVSALEESVATAEARVIELSDTVAEARKVQRTKRPKHPAVARLKEAKAELKEARAQRRDAIQEVLGAATPQLEDARDRRIQREKALYRRYVDSGMHWANFNDVSRRRYSAAVQKVTQQRALGKPAQLRRARRNGAGTLSVQLQRQSGMPQRTPAVIADGSSGKYRNVLHFPTVDKDIWEQMTSASRRKAGRVTVRMRIGQDENGSPTWIEVPVQAHRMLPSEADILEARLTIRRIGPDMRGRVIMMARVPKPLAATEGPRVALHLGWRHEDDGGIRVATWRSDAPLVIPDRDVAAGISLRKIMTSSRDGMNGLVVLPKRFDDRLTRLEKARSNRDDQLNSIRAELITYAETHGPFPNPYDEDQPVDAAKLKAWRSPARFVILGRHLAEHDDWKGTEQARLLTAWTRMDRSAWRSQEHGRQKVLEHRNDLYAVVASIIATQARELVIDNMDLRELARKPTPEEQDDQAIPDQALAGVSRRRTLAAPGELRARAISAAKREGDTVTEVPSNNLSRMHSDCGTINDDDMCVRCGRRYDRDVSATILMLQRAGVVHQEQRSSLT